MTKRNYKAFILFIAIVVRLRVNEAQQSCHQWPGKSVCHMSSERILINMNYTVPLM